MINGLDISSYNLKIRSGLHLTGSTLKGRGCDIKSNKKGNAKKQNGKGLVILKQYFLLIYNYE